MDAFSKVNYISISLKTGPNRRKRDDVCPTQLWSPRMKDRLLLLLSALGCTSVWGSHGLISGLCCSSVWCPSSPQQGPEKQGAQSVILCPARPCVFCSDFFSLILRVPRGLACLAFHSLQWIISSLYSQTILLNAQFIFCLLIWLKEGGF